MKVVCFDLGGVLVRITLNVAEAGHRAGVLALPDVSFGEMDCLLDYQSGRMGTEEYVSVLAQALGKTLEEAAAVHNHVLIEPYPGTLELIQELNRGLKTACLSNTNDLHWREMLGSDRFPNVRELQLPVASHVLGLEKPHAEIFEAFEKLSEARGQDIVFFDASVANVQAATAFGWVAHWIDPTSNTAAQMREFLRI